MSTNAVNNPFIVLYEIINEKFFISFSERLSFGEPADLKITGGFGSGFSDDRLKAGKTVTNEWSQLSRNLKKSLKHGPVKSTLVFPIYILLAFYVFGGGMVTSLVTY